MGPCCCASRQNWSADAPGSRGFIWYAANCGCAKRAVRFLMAQQFNPLFANHPVKAGVDDTLDHLALAGDPGWGFFLMECAVQAASSPTGRAALPDNSPCPNLPESPGGRGHLVARTRDDASSQELLDRRPRGRLRRMRNRREKSPDWDFWGRHSLRVGQAASKRFGPAFAISGTSS